MNCEFIHSVRIISIQYIAILWLYLFLNIFPSIMTTSWSFGYLRFSSRIITFLSVRYNFQWTLWSSALYIPFFLRSFRPKASTDNFFSSFFSIVMNDFRFYDLKIEHKKGNDVN